MSEKGYYARLLCKKFSESKIISKMDNNQLIKKSNII
jgi:hypothetical protein